MVTNISVQYFFIIGTLNLIFLTWQDYKNNRVVDDRKNWVMLGIAISLISHTHPPLLYLIGVSLSSVLLFYILKKIKGFGEADIHTFAWINLGLSLINPVLTFYFFIILSIYTLIFMFFKNIIFKYSEPVQFYGVILLTFVSICLWFGLL